MKKNADLESPFRLVWIQKILDKPWLVAVVRGGRKVTVRGKELAKERWKMRERQSDGDGEAKGRN